MRSGSRLMALTPSFMDSVYIDLYVVRPDGHQRHTRD
jgi:hypothetical protein